MVDYEQFIPSQPLDWLFDRFKEVVWADEPRTQVAANLLLMTIAIVTSVISSGATIFFVFLFFGFASIGMVRLLYRVVRGR